MLPATPRLRAVQPRGGRRHRQPSTPPAHPRRRYRVVAMIRLEVRRVAAGILVQVDDRWHVVLTDDAAMQLAAWLVATVDADRLEVPAGAEWPSWPS